MCGLVILEAGTQAERRFQVRSSLRRINQQIHMGSLGVAVPSSSLAPGNQLSVSTLVGQSEFSTQVVGIRIRPWRYQPGQNWSHSDRNQILRLNRVSQSPAQQRVGISQAAARSTTRFHFLDDSSPSVDNS